MTYQAVFAHEDAALGIFSSVAGMDADALPLLVELRTTEQDGQPLPELRAPRNHHGVSPFGDGRTALHLIRPMRIVAPGRLEGVAEVKKTFPRPLPTGRGVDTSAAVVCP